MHPISVNVFTSDISASSSAAQANLSVRVTVNWSTQDGHKYTHSETANLQAVLRAIPVEDLKAFAMDFLIQQVCQKAFSQTNPKPYTKDGV